MLKIVAVTGHYPLDLMGGAELQTLLLSQGLAELGHEVLFLAIESDQADEFVSGNVTIRKVPGWRTVGWSDHRRYVMQALKESNPDLCYVRTYYGMAVLVHCCQSLGVPVISSCDSAMEATPLGPRSRFPKPISFIRHLRSFLAIRHSSAHICVSRTLQMRLERWFPAKTLRTIYIGHPIPPIESVHHTSSGQIIWVNNLKRVKRPEIFIELAHRLPQYRFIMVGRMAAGQYGKRLQAMLQQSPPNLTYVGPLPLDQVNDLISQSDLLVFTSIPVEGFPNSLIQAWLRGVPTVSLAFDPDGTIEHEGLGRAPTNFGKLITAISELMENEAVRGDMGRRAREYAITQHTFERMVAKHEMLFGEVVRK